MSHDYDVVVIGSGFGGSVISNRLFHKGYDICLMERGREYGMHEFPRRVKDVKENMFYDLDDPKDPKLGYIEFRNFKECDVMTITASGLGGGSLIYANVLLEMPPEYFEKWPYGINRETLDPYYDKVLSMMEASPYPFGKDPYYTDTPKSKYFSEVADKMPLAEDQLGKTEFEFPNLAVRFKGDFPAEQTMNKHGKLQSKCNKCGECDIGCNIHAKNTLDHNYIYAARSKATDNHKFDVKTESLVTDIIPLINEEGYEVVFEKTGNKGKSKIIKAKKVIISCGSIGSSKLLLRMKKYKKLENISSQVGKNWCGNGDLLGLAINNKEEIYPTDGPVITGTLKYKFTDYPDGFNHGMYLQDAGFPSYLTWYFAGKGLHAESIKSLMKFGASFLINKVKRIFRITGDDSEINLGETVSRLIDDDKFTRKAFGILGMGRDRNDGVIKLRADDEPVIKWNMDRSELHYARVRGAMEKVATALGGKFVDNPTTLIDKVVAVHPLGGCIMAESAKEGVVDHKGEVYGHPGLHVVDGSILPTSTGPNPSLTIAAMAEYIADQFDDKEKLVTS